MAKIKAKELEKMGLNELSSKLFELKKELMKENTQIAIGTVPKSPGNVKTIKKNIAFITGLIKEKMRRDQ
tara:strand:- start:9488 stop:9697 length:210 start_codon:yes stop_codon:yes gene_type:complete